MAFAMTPAQWNPRSVFQRKETKTIALMTEVPIIYDQQTMEPFNDLRTRQDRGSYWRRVRHRTCPALQLNREGCELYVSDINADSLSETLGMLSRKDIPADGHVLDVADKTGVHAWADEIAAAKGHVDIVINNAGVALISTVEESDYEHLEWLMGINFWGVVYGTQGARSSTITQGRAGTPGQSFIGIRANLRADAVGL